MQKLLILALCALTLTFAGCGIHKIDIQQGNIITPEMREQIKVGMTKRQIGFILGTPMVIDPFHADRWDYVYSLRSWTNKKHESRHFALFFEGDKLIRIDDGATPAQTSP
ncbi:MAG: outer membrane protein assembly factor BamE [Pseudomonadota bacterium]